MDDDLTFGSSVWGSPDPVLPPLSQSFSAPAPQFDDFDDDFGDSAPVDTTNTGEDDDFGDFGDFGEADGVPDTSFGVALQDTVLPLAIAAAWEPLKLDPMPDKDDLREQVDTILAPIWRYGDVTTNEGIREVEGISQILVSPQSRELYAMLFQSPPPTKPPNWTRSRIRRQHLITLGIPVNLDEVLPPAGQWPCHAPTPSNNATHVCTTGSSQEWAEQFGPKPEIDNAKIAQLLALDSETLAIQPISVLEGYLAALRTQTATTSTLLSHLLQTRDSLQQDSETYNKLIAELVGEAQKIKTKGRTPSRKGSGMS
ncbi:hypothetical protein MIND_00750000 [Mycena indigotica]|uniref:Uncharacterized protein n=1 Tax=Mycena indigotica TaxID=2126181 RepID=A0A8H6SP65_9AGAR|nr:uncharacterized protein MIND_00750000 [Mycena indigotica]KAF7301842.1 hypothetical protein MIND_00750000 [Mycena indigotica]